MHGIAHAHNQLVQQLTAELIEIEREQSND